ncbi:MAG: carbohydrate porin, partial [Gloeomargaritaceae cyanobacterium C42_A2020_066]|nr:carbohydrate porin [Gloeomargaritaceae cyanobacterium C42_A2020_066]
MMRQGMRPAGRLGLLTALLVASGAAAQAETTDVLRQVQQYSRTTPQVSQVTSVSEFSDVKPTDWAFLALQSLVERYGCIAGYPTNPPTFKGNRALTRYEFAAGLNACLDRINELIAAAVEPLATKDDLAKVQKLQEEFAAELATLRGRVDSLEARTATLEAQQFSTTTKLAGDILFTVQGITGGDQSNGSGDQIQDNTTFGYRVYLDFNTSFTGKDLLYTQLVASDYPNFEDASGSPATRTSYEVDAPSTGGTVELATLQYSFPFADDKGTVYISAVGGFLQDVTDTLNPLDDPSLAALSNFGTRNPIYWLGGDAGAGISYEITEQLSIAANFLAVSGSDGSASPTSGLFGSSYGVLTQLTYRPIETLGLGFTYIRSYDAGGSLGEGEFRGDFDSLPGTVNAVSPFGGAASTSDSFGLGFSWQALEKFTWSGWVGYTLANAVESTVTAAGDVISQGDQASILNWAVTLAFSDVVGEGNLAGIVFGQPPRVISNDVASLKDGVAPYLAEGFWRWKV